MQLERFQLALRPRNGWETVDLGMLLTRQWAKSLYGVWALLWLPVAALAFGALYRWPGYAWLLVWWLKPLFDRAYLHVMSGAVFDAPPGVRATLKHWRQWLFGTGLIGALTWRRLSLARTLLQPIWQLEGQRGKAARARARVVGRYARGNAIAAGLALSNAVLALYVALFGLMDLLLPSNLDIDGWAMLRGHYQSHSVEWALFLASAVIDSLLEPFFAGIGFALYLQRRTTLEGWDLELSFRRLGQRLAHGATALLMICLLALPMLPSRTWAAAQEQDPQQVLQEVLRDPALGHFETNESWRQKPTHKQKDDTRSDRPSGHHFGLGVAEIGRLLVWIIGIGLLVLAVLRLAPELLNWRPTGRAISPSMPDVVFGLDVRPDRLPEDVAAAARAALARGALREALSLLYRGALVHWLSNGLEIQPGDTEGDCVRRVEYRHGGAPAQAFRRLVNSWQQAAYSITPPTSDDVSALIAEWPQHFHAPGAAA